MAGRNKKRTVDYFPHEVHRGKTLSTIERKFGNDGYAFWFKLLEILGRTDDHFYDCSSSEAWEYFLAETNVSERKAGDILKTLVNLNAIDSELWNNHKVIFSQNFVNNFLDVYNKRNGSLPDLQFIYSKLGINNVIFDNINSISATEKELKGDKTEIKNPRKGKNVEGGNQKNVIQNNDDSISVDINSISDNINSISFGGNGQTKLNYTKLNNTTVQNEEPLQLQVIHLFGIWGRAPDPGEKQNTLNLMKQFEYEKVKEAFYIASSAGPDKKTIRYVRGILNNPQRTEKKNNLKEQRKIGAI